MLSHAPHMSLASPRSRFRDATCPLPPLVILALPARVFNIADPVDIFIGVVLLFLRERGFGYSVFVSPAVAAGEYALDAFVGGEVTGLTGPGGYEGAAVHVLHLADLTGFVSEGGDIWES